jgi:transcriptional regulator with XRE-family HTH domain
VDEELELDLLRRALGELRSERGLTQEQVAERGGLRREFPGRAEGGRNITYLKLLALCRGTGITPVDLATRVEELRAAGPAD